MPYFTTSDGWRMHYLEAGSGSIRKSITSPSSFSISTVTWFRGVDRFPYNRRQQATAGSGR